MGYAYYAKKSIITIIAGSRKVFTHGCQYYENQKLAL